jgi:uncharacterized membrane protein
MKTIKKYLNRYFIDAMGGMAQGLFATLLIGTIIGTIGGYIPWEPAKEFCGIIAAVCKNDYVVGAAIGVGMARAMGAAPLVMYSSAAVGAAAYSMGVVYNKLGEGLEIMSNYWPGATVAALPGELGKDPARLIAGPGGCFIAVIVAVELGMLVSKRTKVDIIVTPIVKIIPAALVSIVTSPIVAYLMALLGRYINTATEYQPILAV